MNSAKPILLVQPPFHSLGVASIGLSILKSSLRDAGFTCNIRYLSLEFARLIGEHTYSTIGEYVPAQLLLGDLAFYEALYGKQLCLETVRRNAHASVTRALDHIPEQAIRALPSVARKAVEFVSEVGAGVDWDQYLLVGSPTMFSVLPSLALAKEIKKRSAGTAIVLGGSNCNGEMGYTLFSHFPYVDFICRGEGEELVVELARALARGDTDYSDIQGLLWRQGNKVVSNGVSTRTLVPLDRSPMPEFDDWLSQVRTSPRSDRAYLRLPIETSRGCWWGQKHHCVFCGLNGPSMSYRAKSPDRIVAEMKALAQHDVGGIHGVDNIFNHRYLKELAPRFADICRGKTVFFEVKANLRREHVRLFKEAGISWLQPGVESLHTSVLRHMRKGVNVFQNLLLLKLGVEFGLGISWNLLHGFPGEDIGAYQEMMELLPLLHHLQPPRFASTPVRIDRYSPLFDKLSEGGQIEPFPMYELVYPLSQPEVTSLAYYFKHKQSHMPPTPYAPALQKCVREWHDQVGHAVFAYVTRPDGLHVFDTRRVSRTNHTQLRGGAQSLFLACVDGRTVRDLAAESAGWGIDLERQLSEFERRKWIVNVDGRLLNLAVPQTHRIPRGLPDVLLAAAVEEVYCTQMSMLRAAQTEDYSRCTGDLDRRTDSVSASA